MPFFNFYLIKLKKLLCLEAQNVYLRIEAHLYLLTVHPARVQGCFHPDLIREHSRTLSENRKKPTKSVILLTKRFGRLL